MSADLTTLARATLASVFGYGDFRGGQLAAVRAVLQARDTVVLLPTGAGKSICYQVPAVVLAQQGKGTTIVISPLVALMNDQVAALVGRGVAAAALHSHQDDEAQRAIVGRFVRGELALLYVSPERAAMPGFRRLLARTPVALLAVDEAHCLSQWGHDFRQEYMQLGELREHLAAPVIALTATATPRVMQEIAKVLAMRDPEMVRGDFARPNLAFAVLHVANDAGRIAEMVSLFEAAQLRRPGTGRAIVYCSTRKKVEQVTEALKEAGFAAMYYHAGRTPLARERAERGFAQNKARVLVATNAFGMGVDYGDVRVVVHFQTPGSVEAYYQEAGRAGRDGGKAACVLFFGAADLLTQQRLAEGGRRGAVAVQREQALRAMQTYAQTLVCRQQQICEYFTGQPASSCGQCDVCCDADGAAAAMAKVPAKPVGELLDTASQAIIVNAAQHLPKPVGKIALTKALLGSHAKQVIAAGLGQASFHGALQSQREPDIAATIEHLIALGSLARFGKKYPTIGVPGASNRGGRERASRDGATRGESGATGSHRKRAPHATANPRDARTQAALPLPAASIRSVKPARKFRNLGVALELDTYRKRMARQLKWKPYMILQQAVIAAIDAARPQTLNELERIAGMGPAKVARFGDDILQIVQRHR